MACNSAMLLEPITWKGKPQPTGPYPSSGGSDRRTEPQPAGLPYADLLVGTGAISIPVVPHKAVAEVQK